MDNFLQPENKKYKYRDLKVYASTEWLADNKKKYRQVFDRYESSYIYAEFSLYNKQFDVEDWEVDVELRCYSLKKTKVELCILPFKRKVSKFDHTIYAREGWGNKKEGTFWKKGTYYWEAFVDGEKVATKYFYIEDAGTARNPAMWSIEGSPNPYLELNSFRLYEGPYDDTPEQDRIYYSSFGTEETRYIYAELVFRNLNNLKSWQSEIIVKYYNNARELKGQVVRLQMVDKKEEFISMTAGWGSNVKGSWRKDNYTAEVVFMDKLLAMVTFQVGDEFDDLDLQIITPGHQAVSLSGEINTDNLSFENVMEKMDALIGLKEIKSKVRDHAKYIQFLQLRRDKGFQENEQINVHSVFTGNPGTGKTTVAGMMGLLYKKMGILTKGHVHEVDRVDLVGEYIGQTAPKVKEAIEKARGGVLFIDEAYALARSNDDSKDFGREVIEILVKEMSNGVGDLAVIVAGYPKEMKHFIDSNPGLKSRFKMFFDFPDYLPQELSLIATYACQEKHVILNPEAKKKIDDFIVEAYRTRDRSFGNARFVYDIIEKAKINLGLRIMSLEDPRTASKTELEIVGLADVEKLQLRPNRDLPNIPVDENLLRISLEELSRLIGMQRIKEQINEMVRLVRFYRETNKDVLGTFYLHTVFIGNPGTGKTTVARILTKIYKALGVLEKGHMIETDRQGLVAGYVGQTAIKTAEKIDDAIGGVLFIDEAYALTTNGGGAHGDFGDEAIQTLLKRMEDQRGQFFVFVAGYTDNMEIFLKANPGLNSRFDKTLKFEDYSPSELMQIAMQMFNDSGMTLAEDAEEHMRNYLAFVHEYRDKYFGNARNVRQIITDAINKHNLRIAAMAKDDRNDANINLITMEDVESFKSDKSDFVFNKKTIGFGSKPKTS
jgi:SpoVK/Ycf46/Vps4 family AAA+-type ATPase